MFKDTSQEPVVRPKTYASLFKTETPSQENSGGGGAEVLVSQMSSLEVSKFETGSSDTKILKSSYSSTITKISTTENPNPKNLPPRKTHKYAGALEVGDIIYKPTYDGGERQKGVHGRPHLVVAVERRTEENSVSVTIVDMSRAEGKGDKPHKGYNYLINPRDPNFSGGNSSFVKLDKTQTITMGGNQRQTILSKKINDRDMNEILKRLGLKD